MSTPRPTATSSRPSLLRASASRLTAGLVLGAASAVALVACGDDAKKTTNPSNGSSPGGVNTPVITDPNATVTTPGTPAADTGISVVVDVPAGDPVSTKKGTYAMITSDGKSLIVTSYDLCAWLNAHNPQSVPTAGDGYGLVLNLQALTPTANAPYTVNPTAHTTSTGATVNYDANVIATYRPPASNNICKITTRGAVSGSINWTAVSADAISGTITGTVLSYDTSKSSTVSGSFKATKCTTTSTDQTPFTSDPDACHGQPGDPATQQGLTYY